MATYPAVAPIDISPSGGTYEPTYEGETYMPSPAPSSFPIFSPIEYTPSGGTYEPTYEGETYMPSPAPSTKYTFPFENTIQDIINTPWNDIAVAAAASENEPNDDTIAPTSSPVLNPAAFPYYDETFEPTYEGETYLPTTTAYPTSTYYGGYYGTNNNSNNNDNMDPLAPAAAPTSLQEMAAEFKEEWKEWRKETYQQDQKKLQQSSEEPSISHHEALFFFIGMLVGVLFTMLTLWVATRRRLIGSSLSNKPYRKSATTDDNDNTSIIQDDGKPRKWRSFRDVDVGDVDAQSHYSDLTPAVEAGSKKKWKKFRDVI